MDADALRAEGLRLKELARATRQVAEDKRTRAAALIAEADALDAEAAEHETAREEIAEKARALRA